MVFTEHTGLSKLYTMLHYCLNEVDCRRVLIAKSFGEQWRPEDCSAMCDVCTKLHQSQPPTPLNSPATCSFKRTKPYSVKKVDISQHCKHLVLILEHNQALQRKLTAAKLVDVWRGRNELTKRYDIPPVDMSVEECEKVVVFALLQKVLKEEFHFTAYTTICYMSLGPKAEAMKRGLLSIQFSILSRETRNQKVLKKPDIAKSSSSLSTKSVDLLPSMLPGDSRSSLLMESSSSRSSSTLLSLKSGQALEFSPDDGVWQSKKSLKGRKRKFPESEYILPNSVKKQAESCNDVIDISDDSD